MLSVAMKAGPELLLNDEQCPQNLLLAEFCQHPTSIPVVVYARVSPGHRQCRLNDQLNVVREHAKRLGLEIIKVFKDQGKRGPSPADGSPLA